MRILVVGGTRFVGKHLVEQALARGHEVTLFHRGHTGMDLFPDLEHRFGDRNTDLSALADGEWDATIDTCAYVPRQVHDLADVLRGRGGHHLLVSSVSVYATPEGPGIDEDAALIELDDPTTEEVTGETYGGLKACCASGLRSNGTDPRRCWCARRTSSGPTTTPGASRGGWPGSPRVARSSSPARRRRRPR